MVFVELHRLICISISKYIQSTCALFSSISVVVVVVVSTEFLLHKNVKITTKKHHFRERFVIILIVISLFRKSMLVCEIELEKLLFILDFINKIQTISI